MNDTFFNNTPPESEPNAGQNAGQTAGQSIPVVDTVFSAMQEPLQIQRTAATPAETRRFFSRIGLAMLVLTCGRVLGQLAIEVILLFTAPSYATAWWGNWVLSMVPLYGIGLPLMILALRGVPVAPHNSDCEWNYRTLEKPRFTVKHWIILLFIAFGCMYVGNIIGTSCMNLLQVLTGYPYTNALNSMVDESPVWATFLFTCICAPIGEEYIFRKLLIDRTRRYGDTVSIVLSGLLFGLFHNNLFQFFYTFLFGMIVAYIYTRTSKLGLCIGMHAVINFIGGVLTSELSALLPADETAVPTPSQAMISLLLTAWMFGTIIAAIVLLALHWKNRKLSPGTSPLYLKNSPFHVMLNPGMLAAFVAISLLISLSLIPAY